MKVLEGKGIEVARRTVVVGYSAGKDAPGVLMSRWIRCLTGKESETIFRSISALKSRVKACRWT